MPSRKTRKLVERLRSGCMCLAISRAVRMPARADDLLRKKFAEVALLWERIERFETGPDCRIAYDLSKDY